MSDKQLGEHVVQGGVDGKHEPVYGGGHQQPCEREDIMAVEEHLVIVPMGMEMITNVMGVGEGSSNAAKMMKVVSA